MKYIIALDQGTTSSRAVLFDGDGKVCAIRNREFPQIYPRPGWVEHDPIDLVNSQSTALSQVVRDSGVALEDIAAIGITNQRETTIIWDKRTGLPIYNAIVWQCRRTSGICEELISAGHEALIRERTGLLIDAYFSATKIRWILDHVPGAQKRAEAGELLFGTVDSWLLWNLSNGHIHATDYTNASRTMLFNIHTLRWDADILRLLDIPASMLPEVRPSMCEFGQLSTPILGRHIPITGIAGDQQAALFGQACFHPGMVKNTYGTGCFLLMHTGNSPVDSPSRLLTTVACSAPGSPEYVLEGSIFMGGASVQWLRDEMRLIETSAQSEEVARQCENTGGVYLVPAFAGLGAPWWDMYARGTLVGMTRGTGRPHIVRATLEAIAYQTRDVLEAMEKDSGVTITTLKVDGGACANNLLMQFQSDILNIPVYRPECIETTALGAAYAAGLTAGVWSSRDQLQENWRCEREFTPSMAEEDRASLYAGWLKAVTCARNWAK